MKIENKKNLAILFLIILIGIFFRTYHFSDYLRFNPDQARDAGIIRDIINEKADLPLMGPQAGGTDFRLGPVFYYFQLISAKIFGSAPEKVAYPDLFFSVLSIPLLYLFLRKYFNSKAALLSVALFAVSFYAIKYARFAWNPNSTPFFALLFLFSLNEIGNYEQKRKVFWFIILGVALGIGIQLHSLVLFSFPIVTMIYFAFLFFKKNPAWKKAWIVIMVVIFLNIPQIINEFTSLEKNSRAFIVAFDNKSSRSASRGENLGLNVVCHMQASGFILSSVGNDNECDLMKFNKKIKQNKKDPAKILKNTGVISNVILSILFSLGGLALLIYYWKKEKSFEKKNFLGILLLYASVLFIILIPLALETSMRFFLPLIFIPFVFVGLWIKFLREHLGKKSIIILSIFLVLLSTLNIYSIKNKADYLAGKNNQDEDFDEITLGEVKFMAEFIRLHSNETKNNYLEGKTAELFKITKPIKYFTDPYGFKIMERSKEQTLHENDQLFFVNIINNPEEGQKVSKSFEEKYEILSSERFRRIAIYEVRDRK
ncbi:MAG: glycosyltransferase family 39 protein [Candidatus Moraniibacteriota bacterium]